MHHFPLYCHREARKRLKANTKITLEVHLKQQRRIGNMCSVHEAEFTLKQLPRHPNLHQFNAWRSTLQCASAAACNAERSKRNVRANCGLQLLRLRMRLFELGATLCLKRRHTPVRTNEALFVNLGGANGHLTFSTRVLYFCYFRLVGAASS
eukprot:6202627-Pleurochrysis_carterae.AAC.2